MKDIIYKPRLPDTKIPIVIIGAGGIVRDAHLPAYKKAGFEVLGIYDLKTKNSNQLAEKFGIPRICKTLQELVGLGSDNKAIFDLAVPASQITNVLPELVDGSPVLIQKPMGEDLAQAREIVKICNQKNLIGAVNFQLRFAPFVNAARSIIGSGAIGDIYDMEVKITTFTPWHLWDFLAKINRVEILYHSIHYIDVVRSFLGDPKRVMAKTVKHPNTNVASTRSNIIFDYGDELSANISTNHDHNFGINHQQSYIKWEGTKGAIYAKMGLLLDYPHGVPDRFEYCTIDSDGRFEWKTVEIEGTWFPDAFIGSMSSLMRFVEGSEDILPTRVEDAFKTMELVEESYNSSNGM